MGLDEFLEKLTLEDIEKLKKLKLEKSKIFHFSTITFNDLNSIISLEKKMDPNVFNHWFQNEHKLDQDCFGFLQQLKDKHIYKIDSYNEEDLKAKVIIPILNKIDFELDDLKVRDFYDEKLTFETEKFILNGRSDFMVAKGLEYPTKPFFFIQEFKKTIPNDDPRPQLLAELVCAIELNGFNRIKGAYIVGAIWNFVILEKLEKNSYQYFVSGNLDCTKIEDLEKIFKNLLFVKEEIKQLAS